MKTWLKKKLRSWLFDSEVKEFNHRIINIQADIITIQSQHIISNRELFNSGVSEDFIINSVQRKMTEELVRQLETGGFIEFKRTQKSTFYGGNLEQGIQFNAKLMAVKPRY